MSYRGTDCWESIHMSYRGTDYGLRTLSECKGHLFFPLLRGCCCNSSLSRKG
jgi:hypothetical protein